MFFGIDIFGDILVPHFSHYLYIDIIDPLLVFWYFLQFIFHFSFRLTYDFNLSLEDAISMLDVFDFFVHLFEFLHILIFIVLKSCYPALEGLSQGSHLIYLCIGDLLRRFNKHLHFLSQSQVVNFDWLQLYFRFVLLTLLQLRASWLFWYLSDPWTRLAHYV